MDTLFSTYFLCLVRPHLVIHNKVIPVSILHKSKPGRYRPVRVADGPKTARCRFIKNANWDVTEKKSCFDSQKSSANRYLSKLSIFVIVVLPFVKWTFCFSHILHVFTTFAPVDYYRLYLHLFGHNIVIPK